MTTTSPDNSIHPNTWESWDLATWGEQLLAHFFARNPGGDQMPVSALSVTGDELARMVGEDLSNALKVRDCFVAVVVETGAQNGGVLEHAFQCEWSPIAPERRPPVLAHLFLTCLAASEAADNSLDEDAFIAPLDSMCAGHVGSLENLPRLWERFQQWLRAGVNPSRYRDLLLPDPGAWRRVGYSVKLAFPSRHDRQELAALLVESGLSDIAPPVPVVLARIAEVRGRFRKRFLEAFDEFRNKFSGTSHGQGGELLAHRFWSAVRDSAGSVKSVGFGSRTSANFALVAYDVDDSLVVLVVADESAPCPPEGYGVAKFDFSVGLWNYGLTWGDGAEGGLFEAAATRIISGAVTMNPLSRQIAQGVLLFKESQDGSLELCQGGDFDLIACALVKTDLADTIVAICGGGISGRRRAARIPGWTELRDIKISLVPAAKLENTPLARCWILYETLAKPWISLAGGIRSDDGWLGHARVLPEVGISGASQVKFYSENGGGTVELVRSDSENWRFPYLTLAGEGTLVATDAQGVLAQRRMRFNAAPISENFKPPFRPSEWFIEGVNGSVLLENAEITPDSAIDASAFSKNEAYLGAQVGEFFPSAENAVWVVSKSGRNYALKRGAGFDTSRHPLFEASNSALRRRWRKFLFNSEPESSDADLKQARREIRQAASGSLPRREFTQLPANLEYVPLVCPAAPQVRDLISALAGRCSARSGIAEYEWFRWLGTLLGIHSDAERTAVSRAWMECGLIDVLTFTRWRKRSIFARLPKLMIFSDEHRFIAVLQGLALETTKSEIRSVAAKRAVETSTRQSFSRFVPETLVFSADTEAQLIDIAREVGIGFQCASLDANALGRLRTHNQGSPPLHGYEAAGSVLLLERGEDRLDIIRYSRSDRPDVWLAKRGDESAWSFDDNAARLSGFRLAGVSPFKTVGSHELVSTQAYLPLPLGRIAALLGPALPGPLVGGGHGYAFPSSHHRKTITDLVTCDLIPPRP